MGVTVFGPFCFPKGLRPVSPVLHIHCTEKKLNHMKPVKITIPHFLNIDDEEDVKHLGLTFLKADHNSQYNFKPAKGECDFQNLHRTIQTTHLCSFFIACKSISECRDMTTFSVTAVLPKYGLPTESKVYGYFFFTFLNLKTGLQRFEKIINGMQLVDYEVKRDLFQFATWEGVIGDSRDSAISMSDLHSWNYTCESDTI